MSRTPKEGKESKPHRVRSHTIMGQDEVGSGKKSYWPELEITGNIRNISPAVWSLQHLTSLYLNDNCLSRIPAEIARLEHLMYLDLSCNKIRSLPAEIGELTRLRELLLNNNQLRVLPYEIGKLFNLQNIGLKGNPLAMEIQAVYSESNGTLKLLSYMLDNLAGKSLVACGAGNDPAGAVSRVVWGRSFLIRVSCAVKWDREEEE
ncbi:CCR4-NOT transcription complex subunit 6-like, partial [Penaeus vannamei]|uniref:CCR4-NOT transcription complex subunit 6-like n=1 Tax=Penaeus vannamei TaxID=6689 RepID=UPI00387F6519